MSSSTELGCPRSLAFGDLGQHEPRRAFFFPHPRHRITSVVFSPPMPRGLVRNQHTGNFHFITFSCFHRAPYLGSASARDLFENALERTRQRSKFVVAGYVAMPEHIHLLIGEPLKGTVARVIHALKLSVSLRRTERPFWQTRYYDFNVWAAKKVTEKLRYMHRNPVVRGLVARPEDWPWSSFCHYASGIVGTVEIESAWTAARRGRGQHPLGERDRHSLGGAAGEGHGQLAQRRQSSLDACGRHGLHDPALQRDIRRGEFPGSGLKWPGRLDQKVLASPDGDQGRRHQRTDRRSG